MPSFQLGVTPHRRAAGRFVANVRRKLQRAFADNPDITQSDVASVLGVNRSVINRQLRGTKDLSLSRVAEIAEVLGYEVDFDLVPRIPEPMANHPAMPANVSQFQVKTEVTSGAARTSDSLSLRVS